ncbi:MAG: FtsX-like permease family protein [Gemmataceae bacterium]|nr:FtsX-like permease family protein [Gemmataceae bacterium]
MYKLLLCVRYLQTRYLAFVCIVSVMLGVATLIVVNAVMSGFSTKLKDRLHGVLSDVVVDTDRSDGLVVPDKTGRPLSPDDLTRLIETCPAGDRIAAVAPTVEVFSIIQFEFRGTVITKPVRLIGVDPKRRAAVGGFAEYLVHNQATPEKAFDLTPAALDRHEWARKRLEAADALHHPDPLRIPEIKALPVADPFAIEKPKMEIGVGTPKVELFGVVPGYSIAHFRYRNEKGEVVEEPALLPGDAVTLTTVGGNDLKPVWGTFVVTDYVKTEMSEYDQSFVYVPLDQLQKIRGMHGRVTAFQVKVRDYDKDKEPVTRELRKIFPYADVRIATWEEHQGPLLAAIDVERSILNILLFMIVGVAGFSILAIFTMIVSEKYRDIGILKSLGASSRGVMSIFLGYGLLLGGVGCALGTALGLWITDRINWIEAALTQVTGTAVFPRDVYYFKEIPTNVDPLSVLAVNLGAVGIAVAFSLLPAYRAARLHPVRALRFE